MSPLSMLMAKWLYAATIMATLLGSSVFATPCDGIAARPRLYYEYREADCPAPFHLTGDDGHCDDVFNIVDQCIAFCQIRTIFDYATESPFPKSDCHYPLKCTLSYSSSTSWSWGAGLSVKMSMMAKIGITGGYSRSYGSTTGHSWEFEPDFGGCGYFTYVPIRKTACGTMSESQMSNFLGILYCKTSQVWNTPNVCIPQTWIVDGEDDGVVIFVKTNCVTREPLGPENQDPIYNIPGVALPRGQVASMQQNWTTNTCNITNQETTDSGTNYTFEIHGSSFAYGQIGEQGDNLKSNIINCMGPDSLQNWSFNWTQKDNGHSFVATGVIHGPDHIPGCIGDSIMAVGGAMKDLCV